MAGRIVQGLNWFETTRSVRAEKQVEGSCFYLSSIVGRILWQVELCRDWYPLDIEIFDTRGS